MSLHRMYSNEYNLRGCAGERGCGGGANPAGMLLAALLLLAAHLAALAAAVAVARERPQDGNAQAVAALLACVLAGLATWGAMRICRNVAATAVISLAACVALALALPAPVIPHLMTLLTVAACAAAVERRREPNTDTSARRFQPGPLQFSLRTALGLMTLVAVVSAASQVAWPALLADWAQQLTPLVTGAMFGLAIAAAYMVMASASASFAITRRALAGTVAVVVIGCDAWLYAALELGPAWSIAAAAMLVVCSLWLATAVCRNAEAPAVAKLAASDPA